MAHNTSDNFQDFTRCCVFSVHHLLVQTVFLEHMEYESPGHPNDSPLPSFPSPFLPSFPSPFLPSFPSPFLPSFPSLPSPPSLPSLPSFNSLPSPPSTPFPPSSSPFPPLPFPPSPSPLLPPSPHACLCVQDKKETFEHQWKCFKFIMLNHFVIQVSDALSHSGRDHCCHSERDHCCHSGRDHCCHSRRDHCCHSGRDHCCSVACIWTVLELLSCAICLVVWDCHVRVM